MRHPRTQAADLDLMPPGGHALVTVEATRFKHNRSDSSTVDQVISETPVALVYNGISHVVMMATPHQLEDFARGFSLSEGLVDAVRDIHDIEVIPVSRPGIEGIEIHLDISARCFARFKDQRRQLSGRTGCGLCGIDSLEHALPPIGHVEATLSTTPAALARAIATLADHQPLYAASGGVHAAAWISTDGEVALVREDVGRHNALDKLLGAIALQPDEFSRANGFVLITSRASHEMVQKAVRCGIELLAAVSAPTHLAIQRATEAGLSLIGWLRDAGFTIYTHPQRLR